VVNDLAQVKVARMLAPLDDPMMRELVAAIGSVERLAAASPGFVWRLADEGGHGVCVQPEEGGPVFVNVTLWRDYDSLHVFTYRSPHADQLKRRSRWFAATPQPSTALWWVPAGARPTLGDALKRLNPPAQVRPDAEGLLPAAAVRPLRTALCAQASSARPCGRSSGGGGQPPRRPAAGAHRPSTSSASRSRW
jgi:hypothetical protein